MNKKIILYGAGEIGNSVYAFMNSIGYSDNVLCFCDQHFDEINELSGVRVFSFEESMVFNSPFLICVNKYYKDEVIKNLKEHKCEYFESIYEYANAIGEDAIEWERKFCAYEHVDGFENYFQRAEDALGTFWNENSVFYNLFRRLDLTNIVELACGRGRHIQKYINQAGSVTAVDILQKNIDYCKERYKEYKNIRYYTNNGKDLNDLCSMEYSAVFSYDAMVHFEMMDIYSYLKEFYRILQPGGYCLLHHSNNTKDYKVSFETGEHSRNYMSKDLFAYLAYRAGFKIIEQVVIDWGDSKELDCVSLIKK